MQYLLLIYGDERAMDEAMGTASEAEQAEGMKAWYDYSDWLVEKGWIRGGDALQPTDTATSVRTANGDVVVTDGPFAETKEQLGGYYLIETANLDEAIEAAGRCPGALTGTVEVRPIMELPERSDAG